MQNAQITCYLSLMNKPTSYWPAKRHTSLLLQAVLLALAIASTYHSKVHTLCHVTSSSALQHIVQLCLLLPSHSWCFAGPKNFVPTVELLAEGFNPQHYCSGPAQLKGSTFWFLLLARGPKATRRLLPLPLRKIIGTRVRPINPIHWPEKEQLKGAYFLPSFLERTVLQLLVSLGLQEQGDRLRPSDKGTGATTCISNNNTSKNRSTWPYWIQVPTSILLFYSCLKVPFHSTVCLCKPNMAGDEQWHAENQGIHI